MLSEYLPVSSPGFEFEISQEARKKDQGRRLLDWSVIMLLQLASTRRHDNKVQRQATQHKLEV